MREEKLKVTQNASVLSNQNDGVATNLEEKDSIRRNNLSSPSGFYL